MLLVLIDMEKSLCVREVWNTVNRARRLSQLAFIVYVAPRFSSLVHSSACCTRSSIHNAHRECISGIHIDPKHFQFGTIHNVG